MNARSPIPSAVQRIAAISTPHASRYLQQLCKHFAHKIPVTFDERSGQITFSIGECRLSARDGLLRLSLTAEDDEKAAQLQDIVARHLVRFAFREELAITWRAPSFGEHVLDERVSAVLDAYHTRMREERAGPRVEPPGGRDGGQDQRMRAIGPDTGRLLNILARSLTAPTILEIGTSFGYSGIWLAEAARVTGGRLITMELHGYKSAHAQEMAQKAGLADHVDFKVGDAVAMIGELPGKVDFVFLDLWKDLYVPCLEAFYPKLNPGAIIVADNMLGPDPAVKDYGKAARAAPGITSVLLPVGSGIEVSRYEPA
ncbi:DUF2218 domain-containing protein (plasmid) [Agrobacterium tumefaciens]|uniref:DUF2218 domain-containing protein n=2 Tax=Agrobacterium tumefaciens TaxID=358 RepID=A0AAP9J933_AGRTU|nr:DUF2218 domain-containing protein [Agrobacterium tumefaciens]QDY97635.1 DUF2218 domain-containing protein [Agrobacterium tumefaciens]UXS12759.1 DUF2218 domain-containing protein [Agrobacterium tumefaciens]UXS20121.1 DUF2218 domain-containing protein [Agrobacterium tumefaciens]UXS27768.1 DUF2218 domain-containing protein [Agrobacterium tumefaciens]